MQSVARSRKRLDVAGREPLLFGQRGGHLRILLSEVPPALLHDGMDCLGCLRARPHRILIGVDLDGVRRRGPSHGALRERLLVVERQGAASRKQCCNLVKVAT